MNPLLQKIIVFQCFSQLVLIQLLLLLFLFEQGFQFVNFFCLFVLMESVLGILLFYEGIVEETSCSNFGDILEYPGAFESQNNNAETAAHVLNQNGYDSAILKVWRGR
jgi:hypothetical protein